MSILLAMFLKFITNPQVLAGLGIVGGVLFVFFKGKSSGEASVQQEIAQAAEALNTEIHKTENVNQQVETQKNETIQNIDSITDPDELARMLTALTSKTPGNKPDKS